MSVVPVIFSNTVQDKRVLSAMCDTVIGIHGFERVGVFSITVRFSKDYVTMAARSSESYKAPREKILHYRQGNRSSKVSEFFEKAMKYWEGRDEGVNVLLIDVEYVRSESGALYRSYHKTDFYKVGMIETFKGAEVLPIDIAV